ncbi:MAG TPA: hypothetical protein VFP59_01945 [Candidatus Angelobacter sp.]|nr:hypothetical protein [Candidatus Angelobacter sp.]
MARNQRDIKAGFDYLMKSGTSVRVAPSPQPPPEFTLNFFRVHNDLNLDQIAQNLSQHR